MDTRLRRTICQCAVCFGGFGLLSMAVAPARGNIMLFTTTSDFTGWTAGSGTPAVVSSYDSDGVLINGAGNNPGNSGSSINVGGTSTGGSMQLSDPSNLGYNVLAYSPGEAYNQAFMTAVDPGSIAAYTAASSYGNGTLVAYSGTIDMNFTAPSFLAGGSYYQFGVFFNDQQDGYYHPELSTSVINDGTIDGMTTYTAIIPYSFNGGTFNNLNMGIFANSNETLTGPIYVDGIQTVTAVPEPVSGAGILGAAALAMLKRNRKTV
jgi:hypothetical protein